MKVTVITVVIGALGTIPKSLARRMESLEIGEQCGSARILRRVLGKPEETFCPSDSSERPPVSAEVKNSQGIKIITIITTTIIIQKLGKRAGRVGNWRTRGIHTNYSIVNIGLNTEKSPVDPRRLVVT